MKTSKQLSIQVVHPHTLRQGEIEQMCELYLAHHNKDRASCENRIRNGFDLLVLYREKTYNRIVGFNGVKKRIYHSKGFLRPILAIYLGQLFIEKAYRGFNPVQIAVMKVIMKHKLLTPWLKPVIWADALTYKPYLLIAKNSRKFYPHPAEDTPQRFQELMHFLGKKHFAERYDPDTGCVSNEKKLMKAHVAPIYPRLLKNKHIGFYAQKNTGYEKGNGLLIATPFDWGTVWNISKKLFNTWKRQQMKRRRQATQLQPRSTAA